MSKTKPPKPKASYSGSLNPDEDGKSCIWVNDKHANTPLGRFICPKTQSAWDHPEHGKFASIEGFRQWLRCGGDERLRMMYGLSAITTGNQIYELNNCYIDLIELDQEVFKAYLYKIDQYNYKLPLTGFDSLKRALYMNTLPFKIVTGGKVFMHPGMRRQSAMLNKVCDAFRSIPIHSIDDIDNVTPAMIIEKLFPPKQ